MKYKIRILDESSNNEINIGEDEIIEVRYNIGVIRNNDFANNRSSIEMEIKGKMISNIGKENKEDGNKENLYIKNKKNIISLAGWAESYMEVNDYRNVEVSVDLGGNKDIHYKFMNMFVQDFSQELSIEKGIGIFTLKLKQKFHQKERLEIK